MFARAARRPRKKKLVPETYTNDLTWGLLVWVSPGHEPGIPKDWPPILAKHKLLFVSPYNAGNDRNAANRPAGTIERFRLALDASYNMRLRYRISPKRIYASGFSGGGRVASMLGVAFSDVFTGTIPICGVNFYMTIPAGGDQVWEPSYKTQPRYLTAAKNDGRFVHGCHLSRRERRSLRRLRPSKPLLSKCAGLRLFF